MLLYPKMPLPRVTLGFGFSGVPSLGAVLVGCWRAVCWGSAEHVTGEEKGEYMMVMMS